MFSYEIDISLFLGSRLETSFRYFPKIGFPISDMFKIFDEGKSTLHFPNITLSIENNNSERKRKTFNA